MAELKFDKDAVSENIRTFLSTGIGSTSPQGTPQFGNRDVELHQEVLARTQTPVSANTPIGQNISGMGANFRSLDNPDLAGVRDVTIRIGELEGQKFENKAELTELIQGDFAVSNAEQQVQILSDAMRLAGDPRKKAKIGQALQSATLIRDQAVEAATLKANAKLGKRNALLDADIARLTSRKQALDEEAARVGRTDKLTAPKSMLDGVVASGRAENAAEADKFLKASPPATIEMWRQGTSRFNTGTPLEYWSGLIDAGGRPSYQDYILSQVPDSDRENVAAQITKMDDRMAKARIAAKQTVDASLEGKQAGPRRFAFQKEPELRAQAEAQAFDTIMREANFKEFQGRLVSASAQDLDKTWFGTNDEDFEIAKQLQSMLNPSLGSAEMVYAEAAKRLGAAQGISENRMIGIVGRIWDNMRNQHDAVNKPLGAGVSQKRYDSMIRTMNSNMFQIDRLKIEAAARAAEQGPALVTGADIPEGEGITSEGINESLNAIKSALTPIPGSTPPGAGRRPPLTGEEQERSFTNIPPAQARTGKPVNALIEEQARDLVRRFDQDPAGAEALLQRIAEIQAGNR
jgi:hypothetical protein